MRISDKYNLVSLANAIYDTGANLAERRLDWLALMYSMAGGGEPLRASFHKLASQGSTYKFKENDREFTKAIKKTSDKNLAWLLKKAKGLGINLEDHLSIEGRRAREDWINARKPSNKCLLPSLHSKPKMNFIPNEYLTKCRSNNSTFVQSLVSTRILTAEQAFTAADLYHLGAMKDGSVIYWQIDEQQRMRDGKVMLYGNDCHRIKDKGAQWIGFLMRTKLRGTDGKPLLPMTWQATQCLFGLHLLTADTSLPINIVEAEKTAIILSQLMPDTGVWMAAGGETQLTLDKLAPLAGHKVILFPDTDPDGKTCEAWKKIANEAHEKLSLDVSVNMQLERLATPDQRQRKIDIADLLIEYQPAPSYAQPQPSPELQEMLNDNPDLQLLIDEFGLTPNS